VNVGIQDINAAGQGQVFFTKMLLEDVTGRTNQNPSEYVPALATANADSGAIGVRFFPYLNGNTVASNVVTEAQGAAITSSEAACAGGVAAGAVDAAGPLGLLSEAVRSNLILQSQTLQTTWAVSNALDVNAVSADQYVANDGATTMDKLSTKATNAPHYYKQAFTFSASVYSFEFFLRYVAATPIRWGAIAFNDGTTTWAASFDLLNGVAGAVTANTTSSIFPTGLANVYRCVINSTTNAAAAAGNVYVSLNTSDSASLQSWNAAGTEVLGAWQSDLQAAAFMSSPIPTTTIAAQRNADVVQGVSAGNLPSTHSGTMQVTPSVAMGTATVFHFGTYVDASNYTAILSDGTNLIARKRIGGANHDATIAWARTAGTVAKVGWRFDTTNGCDVWLNGTKGTNDATLTAAQIGAAFQVGADGNSLQQDFCMHRLQVIYPAALSDSRMAGYTT